MFPIEDITVSLDDKLLKVPCAAAIFMSSFENKNKNTSHIKKKIFDKNKNINKEIDLQSWRKKKKGHKCQGTNQLIYAFSLDIKKKLINCAGLQASPTGDPHYTCHLSVV